MRYMYVYNKFYLPEFADELEDYFCTDGIPFPTFWEAVAHFDRFLSDVSFEDSFILTLVGNTVLQVSYLDGTICTDFVEEMSEQLDHLDFVK